MAIQTDKSKLQDPFITPRRISTRDEQNRTIFIGRIRTQEVTKQ
jgi:hypothetical protein